MDARTEKTNEADGVHTKVKEEHTTSPMIPIKKVLFALCRLKDFNATGPNWQYITKVRRDSPLIGHLQLCKIKL